MSPKRVTHATRGFVALPERDQREALREFEIQSAFRDDWFYSVLDGRVFVCDNGETGFTAMLAHEY